eukprot:CAMPEP_0205821414 /NCGR_PEP_ID=MMETSP0206-20130828/7479_1 /ASSEMBLY_ACC=CAM_ASM_000279 /TAXON_ID=36767 /ORGANISM="Euplotes focardii, Strain TN1" /LENGTH=329 /DNA_ID=CAMNT_0053116881 /DNA_START=93 /DNA_END=1082 /DNA_ORIENTATION=-
MSGAGALGAYQAAVFVGLVNQLPEEEVSYDVITGVSAGSLNALGLSGFEAHQVIDASNFIYGMWNSIDAVKVYKTWPGGILAGFFQKGLFDLTPGREFLAEQLGDLVIKKKITFSAINADTGQYVNFDYNVSDTRPDFFIDAAFASSSIPAAFPHVHHDDMELIDGGTVWNIDIDSPIRRCREIVDNDEDIILDIILVSAATVDEVTDFSGYSAMDHLLRGHEIFGFYNGMNDFNSSTFNYPNVDFRYLIFPTEKLSNSPLDILTFSQKIVDRCFEAGQKDAKLTVDLGHGVFKELALEFSERHQNGEDVNFNEMIQERLEKINKNNHS